MRSTLLATVILVLAAPAVPAAAQSGAPPAAPTGPDRLACQANLTRLRVSIPPWEGTRPWAVRLLDRMRPMPEGRRAGHAYCSILLDEAVVRFGSDGSG
jgi:hypothetical protein